jgi:transcriptional regulator with XRE-family HTH domain
MPQRKVDAVDIDVGGRIEHYRRAVGLSRNKLATSIGATIQEIVEYENGRKRVGAGRLLRIAQALGIPVRMLYLGNLLESKPNSNPTDSLFALLTNVDALRLLQAFSCVHDYRLRLRIIQLVERTAAGSGGYKRSRRGRYGRGTERSINGGA